MTDILKLKLKTNIDRRTLLRMAAGVSATVALSACTAPVPSAPSAPTAAAVAPASAAKPAETPKKGGTLVIGLEAEPGTLDNSVGTGYHTSIVQRMLYESLVAYDLTSTADVLPIKPDKKPTERNRPFKDW